MEYYFDHLWWEGSRGERGEKGQTTTYAHIKKKYGKEKGVSEENGKNRKENRNGEERKKKRKHKKHTYK